MGTIAITLVGALQEFSVTICQMLKGFVNNSSSFFSSEKLRADCRNKENQDPGISKNVSAIRYSGCCILLENPEK
jgi:hypothetical protein